MALIRTENFILFQVFFSGAILFGIWDIIVCSLLLILSILSLVLESFNEMYSHIAEPTLWALSIIFAAFMLFGVIGKRWRFILAYIVWNQVCINISRFSDIKNLTIFKISRFKHFKISRYKKSFQDL